VELWEKALSVGSLEPGLFKGRYWICNCMHTHIKQLERNVEDRENGVTFD